MIRAVFSSSMRHVFEFFDSLSTKVLVMGTICSRKTNLRFESHGRTFGKNAESRNVETIYTDLRCFRLLQTLVLKFFMVLKHMNCLLNVIIKNFLKSHGRT